MKTILVNPDANLYRNIPPLALAYLATILKVRVVDQNTKPEPPERFLNKKVDVLGIFVRSISGKESKRISGIYRDKYPKAKVKSIYTPIDVQCCYPTIQFDEVIKFDKPFGDAYPFPDFSLFDSYEIWLQHWQDGSWPYGILTSVGCPFQCTYCAARNRKWKARSPKNCVEELKQAKKKYKIKLFEILDDAFNVDKKRVLEFCKLVKPLNLPWVCANGLRADLFDEEMALAMAEACCESVSFGVESTDPKVLENIKKGETIEQISSAVDTANKYFKNVNGFFIVGLPGATYKSDLKSVEWIVKNRITGIFSYYIPVNGINKKQNGSGRGDIFYGKEARPQSDAYPRYLQKKVYRTMEYMQGPTTLSNLIPRLFKTLSLFWQFDREKLPTHVATMVKKFI